MSFYFLDCLIRKKLFPETERLPAIRTDWSWTAPDQGYTPAFLYWKSKATPALMPSRASFCCWVNSFGIHLRQTLKIFNVSDDACSWFDRTLHSVNEVSQANALGLHHHLADFTDGARSRGSCKHRSACRRILSLTLPYHYPLPTTKHCEWSCGVIRVQFAADAGFEMNSRLTWQKGTSQTERCCINVFIPTVFEQFFKLLKTVGYVV